MEAYGRRRRIAVFAALFTALVAVTALSAGTGSVSIPAPEIARILLRRGEGGMQSNIIWQIRLPRLLMAAVLVFRPSGLFPARG